MKMFAAGISFSLLLTGLAFADAPACLLPKQASTTVDQTAASTTAAVNAGNRFCPVMGSPVTEKSPYTVEYKGKTYNLCCPGCKDVFLKDPETYLKKMEAVAKASK